MKCLEPKEKAIELVHKFCSTTEGFYKSKKNIKNAKQCALIAVDEILIQWEYIDTYLADLNGELNPNLKYWYEVKQEIINFK